MSCNLFSYVYFSLKFSWLLSFAAPALSPKMYPTSAPMFSDIARDYLIPNGTSVHVVSDIYGPTLPNTLRLLLSQFTSIRFPLNPFYGSFFCLLQTWPWPCIIHPNVYHVLSWAIFMRIVDGIDIVSEDLLYLYYEKHRKAGCFSSLMKYLSLNT